MGMEICSEGERERGEDGRVSSESLETLRARPCILFVGPPNVGKRSILQRLVSMGKATGLPLVSNNITYQGWTIDTKYYTANVCIQCAQLVDGESDDYLRSCILFEQYEALVLVLDLSNFSSFAVLQEWVSKVELKFEVMLCVGNKADRVPDHYSHTVYRRMLQKQGQSSSDPHPEFEEFGIQRDEGVGLLGDGHLADEKRQMCTSWCTDHGFEYIEACAINGEFDSCLSVDGDSQGLQRIWGALAAHMWPGMDMKPQNGPSGPIHPSNLEECSSDDDSNYSVHYELLSNGSAEAWDGEEGPWTFYDVNGQVMDSHTAMAQEDSTSASPRSEQASETHLNHPATTSEPPALAMPTPTVVDRAGIDDESLSGNVDDGQQHHDVHIPAESSDGEDRDGNKRKSEDVGGSAVANGENTELDERKTENFERLVYDMGQMRENLQHMPDSYRRDMAARLAMQMVSMLEDTDEEY